MKDHTAETPPFVDVDVHHTWKADADIIQYLPKRWRETYAVSSPVDRKRQSRKNPESRISNQPILNSPQLRMSVETVLTPDQFSYPKSGGDSRPEWMPNGTGRPASDYDTLRSTLLDIYNVKRAILSFNVGMHCAVRNPWLAMDLTRAGNDWNRDHWLGIPDDRLRSVVVVQTHVPDEAAKEIRRVGRHPKIAAVLLGVAPPGKPLGHPLYHPIYEAAVEVGLPIAIHIGGDFVPEFSHMGAGGIPSTYFEIEALAQTPVIHHAMSMIVHGVFDKYPDLKVVLVELGVTWLPWLLWNMDANYKLLKRESPYLQKLPSEYFREHIRVATMPLETIPARKLHELIEEYRLDDLLCFSTDYPHYDEDDPVHIAKRLPKASHDKIFYKNACYAYGWNENEVLATERPTGPVRVPATARRVAAPADARPEASLGVM